MQGKKVLLGRSTRGSANASFEDYKVRIHWYFGGGVIGICMLFGVVRATGLTIHVPAQIRFVSPGIVRETDTPGSIPSVKVSSLSANFTVSGSASNLINIDVANISVNETNSNTKFRCAYAGSNFGPCSIVGASAPGVGKTLSVNVEPSKASPIGEPEIPTFLVTVTYQ